MHSSMIASRAKSETRRIFGFYKSRGPGSHAIQMELCIIPADERLSFVLRTDHVRDTFPFPYVLPFPYIHVLIGLAPPI